MRRKDREVTDISQIRAILDTCKTCHLAMVDEGGPYVIPLSYAYELEDSDTLTLYFHSAREGRKISALQKNGSVCFEMSAKGEPIFDEATPCESGYYYSSVHGFGTARFIEDADEKCRALALIMKHQAALEITFTPAQANAVCVFKVTASSFTAKQKRQAIT